MKRKKIAVAPVAARMMDQESLALPPWNRITEPSTSERTPPVASSPWLATFTSAMKNAMPSTMSAMPA